MITKDLFRNRKRVRNRKTGTGFLARNRQEPEPMHVSDCTVVRYGSLLGTVRNRRLILTHGSPSQNLGGNRGVKTDI